MWGFNPHPIIFLIKMLSSRSEKELYGEFERERNKALKDSSTFAASDSEYSLEDLGVGIEGEGVNDPKTYLVDASPADPNMIPRVNAVDVRRLPGHD